MSKKRKKKKGRGKRKQPGCPLFPSHIGAKTNRKKIKEEKGDGPTPNSFL